MKQIRIAVAILSLLALAAVPAAAQDAVPPEARQWEIPNVYWLGYGVDYELHNQKNRSQLGYKKIEPGSDVDLGWVGHSGGHFKFMRKAPDRVRDHRRGRIDSADVAIYNTKAQRYLKYRKFDNTQAELEWSRTPAYEWQLRDQSTTAAVVSFALFNSRAGKYLVLQTKNVGINLGWWREPPVPQSASVSLSAQTVIQGWVPYLGSFPVIGSVNGVLLNVQNASDRTTLLFVKPGKSTINCGDKGATVIVAPRATMTGEQMKTLYGSATPRLPATFLACVAAPASQSISLTYLNITYRVDP